MKLFSSFSAFILSILVFSYVSINAQNFPRGKSGRTVAQNVERQILRMPRYEVFDYIGYSINGGTVTLVGKVRNAINKSDAENRVEDIAGVTQVVNNIEILPLGSFDDSIRLNLYRQLSNSAGLYRYFWASNPSVRLIVDRGNVSLEGFVSNRGDYNIMNVVANSVPGVFSVTNNLVIENGRAR